MTSFSKYLNKKLQNPEFKKNFLHFQLFDDIADQILSLRLKRGYSQSQLAKKVGTTQAVISRIENGSVNSSLSTIQKVAESLDASINVDVIPDEDMNVYEFLLAYSQFKDNEYQENISDNVKSVVLYSKKAESICNNTSFFQKASSFSTSVTKEKAQIHYEYR